MIIRHSNTSIQLRTAEASAAKQHQIVPRTLQRSLKSEDSREKNRDVTCLNLLDCADIEVGEFRQTFLRQIPSNPLAADIGPKGHTLGISSAFRHAPLGRIPRLTNTARWGVKCCVALPMKSNCSLSVLTTVAACLLWVFVFSANAENFATGSRIELSRSVTLTFKGKPYGRAHKGDKFTVEIHRPSERRVYLRVRDREGQDIALAVEQDAVRSVNPYAENMAKMMGLAVFEQRKKPIPDVDGQALAISRASAAYSASLTDADEAARILMRGLNGTSGSKGGRFIIAFNAMSERLSPQLREKARIANRPPDTLRADYLRLLHEGDLEGLKQMEDRIFDLPEDPLLPWADIIRASDALTVEERVEGAKALRKQGVCLASGMQYLPFSRRMLSDVLSDRSWSHSGAKAVLDKVVRENKGEAFGRFWGSIGSLQRGQSYETTRAITKEELGFLSEKEQQSFADTIAAAFSSNKATWLRSAPDYVGGVEPSVACDLALILTSRLYQTELAE